MKTVFYPGVLGDTNMTLSDKLVYCQILYRSLWDNASETFDKDGKFSPDNYWAEMVPIGESVTSGVSKGINITSRQYFISYSHLREIDYITSADEYGPKGYLTILPCFAKGYFELITESFLTGWPLIVYSYIYFKSKRYGWVDKYHSKIAEELQLSRSYLERVFTKLKDAGLIQYKDKGRQRLIRPTFVRKEDAKIAG